MSDITHNVRGYSQHPWDTPYSPSCIIPKCTSKTYYDGQVHYSLCLGCLKENALGPFKKRHHKEDSYSTLFFLTDYERKLQ